MKIEKKKELQQIIIYSIDSSGIAGTLAMSYALERLINIHGVPLGEIAMILSDKRTRIIATVPLPKNAAKVLYYNYGNAWKNVYKAEDHLGVKFVRIAEGADTDFELRSTK